MTSGADGTSDDDTWVEVRDEPQHHRRFENEYARVYDVRVPPGDRTLFHRHTEDTLYVCIASTRIEDQTFGAAELATFEVPHEIALCRPHRDEPLTHRIRNVGESSMRMIGAELRRQPATVADEPLEARAHTLQWETPRLRVYRLDLRPRESTGRIRYAFSGLTIALTEGNLTVREEGAALQMHASAPGDAAWHDGPRTLEIENSGEAPFSAYVAEWK